MTDGDEDAGTEGRKCYLITAPNRLRQTHKHTYMRLIYVEEATTTLKSGRSAPPVRLCCDCFLQLQNLGGHLGNQKKVISFKLN